MSLELGEDKLGLIYARITGRPMLVVKNTVIDLHCVTGIIETQPGMFEIVFNARPTLGGEVLCDKIPIEAETARKLVESIYKPIVTLSQRLPEPAKVNPVIKPVTESEDASKTSTQAPLPVPA